MRYSPFRHGHLCTNMSYMRNFTQNVGMFSLFSIQHQTCVDEIFKCTTFVGYGGVIFFYRVPPTLPPSSSQIFG